MIGLTRDRLALVLAPVVPVLAALLLTPLRGSFANTDAALLLIAVVVAVAANGYRLAGIVAAVSAALSFDFFFTEPYQRLTIRDREDVETAVLLLLVGIAVTELAVWGRHQQARASRSAGYLAGIEAAAQVAAIGGSTSDLIDHVSRELNRALGLRASHFQAGAAGLGDPARLRRDGEVEWRHAVWDVQGKGLPVETEIELLVENGGRLCGRFMLTAKPGSRVSLGERKVAIALADQVGAVLR